MALQEMRQGRERLSLQLQMDVAVVTEGAVNRLATMILYKLAANNHMQAVGATVDESAENIKAGRERERTVQFLRAGILAMTGRARIKWADGVRDYLMELEREVKS